MENYEKLGKKLEKISQISDDTFTSGIKHRKTSEKFCKEPKNNTNISNITFITEISENPGKDAPIYADGPNSESFEEEISTEVMYDKEQKYKTNYENWK